MNDFFMQFAIIYILITAFMAARPWLSRKNVLFGVVFGSSKIRRHDEAAKIIGRFVWLNIVLAAALAALFLLVVNIRPMTEDGLAQMFVASVFILVVIEAIPYILANRSMKELKESISDDNLVRDRITVELGADQEKRPVHAAWFLLLLVPVAVTIAIALYYYPKMPDRIPTHFDLNGNADSWSQKSAGVFMGPVTGQIILAAILFLVGIFSRNASASIKGSPGAAPKYYAFRRFLSYWIIVLGLFVESSFMVAELTLAGVALNMQFFTIVLLAAVIAFTAVLIAVFFRMTRRPEPTGTVYDDDSRWVLGMFYFNPSDPSIFVEKRSGIGQTLNFGRPAAWIVIAGIVIFIILATILGGS